MPGRPQLTPEQLERADRFARAITLTSSFDYFVVVGHAVDLTEPFAREVIGRSVMPDGSTVAVRWFRWAGAQDAIEQLDKLRESGVQERQIVVVDLSQIGTAELDGATAFARALNLRRDVLSGVLVGGLVVCIPDWLEMHVAAAAPDLWSVVSSVVLRKGAESFPAAVMDDWWNESDARFEAVRSQLEQDPYAYGGYTLAYAFEPGAVSRSSAALLEVLRRLPQYTGWSTWLVSDTECPPHPFAGSIECSFTPVASDYWRVNAQGLLYLARAYQEDEELDEGNVFSASLPIWRVGEALLHARDLGQALGLRDHVRLRVRARWTGLTGRTLSAWPAGPMAFVRPAISHDDAIVSETQLELGDLSRDLPSAVETLTRPVLESFGFYRPPSGAVEQQLRRLETRS
jgi:hypothetical protein